MATQGYSVRTGKQGIDLSRRRADHVVLANMLRDTGASVLAMLSEKYGLRRVPGLGKSQIADRLLRNLDPAALEQLEEELIAARFGQASADALLEIVLEDDSRRLAAKPRFDEIKPDDAILIESGSRRWLYTMRGHDVLIDLDQHVLACDCPFFAFASRRKALCKHVATALKLVPQVYAREALIDLAVARKYGGDDAHWQFESRTAA